MNLKLLLSGLLALSVSAIVASAQISVAQWTFDTNIPLGTNAAGVWLTNIVAESGTGVASSLHANATQYTSSVGNATPHSFSAASWTAGDFYQFTTTSAGVQGLTVTYDQVGSGTGPSQFYIAYSTNGVDFTSSGVTNTVLSSPTWSSSGTPKAGESYTVDLTSITVLNNCPLIYLRLVDASTTSIGGSTVQSGGTDRVDTFTVTAASFIVSAGPPQILTNPRSTNGIAGRTFNLSVVASGSDPRSYQWYYPNLSTPLHDGVSISGSTSSTLTLSSVTTNVSGNYQVIVTNSSGAATSTVAVVSVLVPVVTNIAYVRTLQDSVNWQLTDSNTLFTVQGTVTTYVNMTSGANKEYYIQDGTGGIAVFITGGGVVPDPGSIVQVTGPLGQFRGLLEMNLVNGNPDHSANILSAGNPLPAPLPFTFSSIGNVPYMEAHEGSLIVVSNVFLGFTNASFTAAGVTLTNLSGQTYTLFVNAAETDLIGQTVPQFASSITGILGQFKSAAPFTSGYELDITHAQDLVVGTPPPPSILLSIQASGSNVVLTWGDPSFSLQAAPTASGTYTNIPSATSPYTDPISGTAKFYRLSQ